MSFTILYTDILAWCKKHAYNFYLFVSGVDVVYVDYVQYTMYPCSPIDQ